MNELFTIALEQVLEQSQRQAAYQPRTQIDPIKIFTLNRTIARFFLGIVSIGMILVGVVIGFFLPDFLNLIRDLAVIGFLALGTYSLFLVIQNKPGNIWRIVFLTPVFVIVAATLLISLANVNSKAASSFVLFVLVFGVLTPLFMMVFAFPSTQVDPLPISSRFLRIIYPRRYRHLIGIREFASTRGWNVSGLQGPTHALVVEGLWNGRKAKIISEHARPNNQTRKACNLVTIVETFNEIFYGVIANDKGFRLFPPEDTYKEFSLAPTEKEQVTLALKRTLATGLPFFGKKGTIYINNNKIAYGTEETRLLENQENVRAILDWLASVGQTMTANNLTLPEKPKEAKIETA